MCRVKRLIAKRNIIIFVGLLIGVSVGLHAFYCLWIKNKMAATSSTRMSRTPYLALTNEIPPFSHSTPNAALWDKPADNPHFFLPRKTRLTPLNSKVVLHSNNVCKVPPFLLILVISLHHHTEERRVIRETWGSVAYGRQWPEKNIQDKIKIVFLFGKAQTQIKYSERILRNESKLFKDIVMFDFEESYFNLSLKVLMGLKWMKAFCAGAQFVMKTDEDVFIDVPQLITKLHTKEWMTRISGLLFTVDKTYRKGKYSVSQEVYPFTYYPPHVKGNVYFMPTDIALKLLNVSEFMPYINMEDVHVTGILAIAAKVNKYQRFSNDEFSPMGIFRSCDFTSRRIFAAAYIRPQQARDIWTTLEKPGLCGLNQ